MQAEEAMSTLVLKDAKIWFDKYDFSGEMNSVAVDYSAAMLDNTVFGCDTKSNKGGQKTTQISLAGLWNAKHDGMQLVTNGTFDTVTTGWTAVTATLSVVSNKLRVAITSAYGYAYQVITTEIGKEYILTLDYTHGTNNKGYIRIGTGGANAGNLGSAEPTSTTSISLRFVAQAVTTYITLGVDDTSTQYADFDNVSVVEAGSVADEQLFGNIGLSNKALTLTADAGADGDIAYFLKSILGQYSLNGSIGELLKYTVTAQGNTSLVRGVIMMNANITSTTNGTGQQLGAVSSTQKLWAALHVPHLTLGDTLTVTIQSDDNQSFTSPTTVITFTALSDSPGSEIKNVAGPITDTYYRAVATLTGSLVGATVVVALGIL